MPGGSKGCKELRIRRKGTDKKKHCKSVLTHIIFDFLLFRSKFSITIN
jgi:hypothetical protein